MQLFEMTMVILDPLEKGFDEWVERLEKSPYFLRCPTNDSDVCYIDSRAVFNAQEVLDMELRSSHEMDVC